MLHSFLSAPRGRGLLEKANVEVLTMRVVVRLRGPMICAQRCRESSRSYKSCKSKKHSADAEVLAMRVLVVRARADDLRAMLSRIISTALSYARVARVFFFLVMRCCVPFLALRGGEIC